MINEIRRQSAYSFVYIESDINNVVAKDIKFADAGVDEILDYYLAGTSLSYEIVDNTIIIREKGAQPPDARSQNVTVTGTLSMKREENLQASPFI